MQWKYHRPFKRLQEARYQDLLSLGFAPWESRVLSNIPRHVPYMHSMIEVRYKEFWRITKAGATTKEFEKVIVDYYKKRHFSDGGGARSIESVWAYVRSYEEPYKKKHPEYKPKYKQKRARDIRRSINKLDATISEKNLRDNISDLIKKRDSTDFQPRRDMLQSEIDKLMEYGKKKYGKG